MCPNLWPRVETLRLSWVMGEVATLTELILDEKTMFWMEKGSIIFFSQRKKINKKNKKSDPASVTSGNSISTWNPNKNFLYSYYAEGISYRDYKWGDFNRQRRDCT